MKERLWQVGFMAAILAAFWLTGCTRQENASGYESQASASEVSIGSTAYLDIDGEPEVWLARSKDGHDILVKASITKDSYRIGQLIAGNAIYLVPRGTRVLVIDEGFGVREVRVLSGQHVGETGWISYEFVKAEAQ